MSANRVDNFCDYMARHKRLLWPAIEKNRQRNSALVDELGGMMLGWAENYLGEGYLKTLADGYTSFVMDVNQSQMRYEKEKRYRFSSFAQACAHVYHSDSYGPAYHWGVFVTTFAWEHHLHIFDFFQRSFLNKLPPGHNKKILELGSGSGVWGLLVATHVPEWKVTGIDISNTFVSNARDMARANGFADRVEYHVGDALTHEETDPADACISCFVLEHLENPIDLLKSIAKNLGSRKRAFVTGALSAAEIDHIAEFRHESELVLMAEQAGFRVESIFSSAPPEYPEHFYFLPRSMAMILEKKQTDIW